MIWKWGTAQIWTRDLLVYYTGDFTAKPKQPRFKLRQWVKIILTNKPGKHNYKPKIWFENEVLPGFEPGISCLLDRRFNRYHIAM